MTNLGKQCLFLIITLMIIAGCSKQPSPVLHSTNFHDAPLPPFSTPVTPEEVRLAFYKYSASAIITKLSENGSANWIMALDKISQGDAQWIRYGYKYLRPGASDGASGDFRYALSLALQYNPEAVLSLDGIADTALMEVCGWSFIEPEWDFVVKYGNETLAALRKIDNPDLLESRDMCIRKVERGFSTMKRLYWRGEFRPY